MKKEYSLEELTHKAASYCSISEHCISEVEKKLKAWEVSETNRQKIIDRLLEEDFINEERFATFYVRDKFNFNHWGRIKISMMLKEKGIDSEVISKALEEIDEAEYEEILSALLIAKQKSIKYNYEYEKQGKLFRFAQSRGFENDIINQVLRTVL